MGIIKLLQEWCVSILNGLVKICLIPFGRFVRAPTSVTQQTPPDPQNASDQLAPFAESSSAEPEPSQIFINYPQNAFDQLAPPFAESSSAEPSQIFINHCGKDVKYTLATKIHHELEGMGYRAFLDVEAIEPGDVFPTEIEAAMNSASLHVAIFSPMYAESPWCLAELAFILKTGAKVIPIFYHVDPSDLRLVKQRIGKYADAFSKHEKKDRYTQEKLNEWKEALHKISFCSGIPVNNNEEEDKALKKVVNFALKAMKNDPMLVAEHPVGLDELVQGFNSVASEDRVKITGIVGMGGSGKTTLAKELFNRHFSSFDKCSFVADVRDAAYRNALPDKQKKLLEDLGVNHQPFDSVDEGMAVLAKRLSFVRALIVLDDVDHIDQLNGLLTYKGNLGSQSMIIVTTRELGVLESWGFPSIYKMPRVEDSHAERLFCWHAFKQPFPPDDFKTLVQEFLDACDGLPLSLKVFGAQLYGKKSKDYWKSQLHKIRRILPGEIQQRLQASYDALDEEEKEMFLDVACFLIGELKSTAIAVWDGMDLSGLYGLQTLVNKCLVELVHERRDPFDEIRRLWDRNVFNEERIRMHDHLRDMGRQIARTHSSYRLWWSGQIHNMKNHFKIKKLSIRGIRPAATFQAVKEYNQQLLGISYGLRLLHVKGNEFTKEFASLSEDLVCLQWDQFGRRNFPSWLTLKHLSVLEIHGADELKELWKDNVDPPLQLRKLSISGSWRIKQLPTSIGRLEHLKMISLRFEGSSLPEELCCLLSLEYLHLDCPLLRSLPAGFGNLKNLKFIYLQSCNKLSTLSDSFEQLIHLEDLNLSSCTRLSSLPAGFGNLKNLKLIYLKSYNKLSTLPDSFEQLIHLEYLSLSSCTRLSSLPAGFGNLLNLKRIDLSHCYELRTLPDSFKHLIHLEHLDLYEGHKLTLKLDAFQNIRKLKMLGLNGCKELEDLPNEIVNQTCLRELDLRGCIKLRDSPTNIGQLVNLQSLTIENHILSSLQTSGVSFSSLEDLTIVSSADAEEEVSRVSISDYCCPNLQHFTFTNILYGNRNRLVTEIETLPMSLKSLSIGWCEVLKTMRCLTGLASLEQLDISFCWRLEEMSSFSDLVSLKKFNMYGCPKVEKIDGLQHNKSLKELRLSTSWKLPGIESLENVEGLEYLEVKCERISAVKGCIQSLKECPTTMRIRGRVSRVVEPIVDSLKFPDLVVEPIVDSLQFPDLVVEPIVDSLKFPDVQNFVDEGSAYFYYHQMENKDIYVSLQKANDGCCPPAYFPEKHKAVSVWGRRERVVEAFNQLLTLLE